MKEHSCSQICSTVPNILWILMTFARSPTYSMVIWPGIYHRFCPKLREHVGRMKKLQNALLNSTNYRLPTRISQSITCEMHCSEFDLQVHLTSFGMPTHSHLRRRSSLCLQPCMVLQLKTPTSSGPTLEVKRTPNALFKRPSNGQLHTRPHSGDWASRRPRVRFVMSYAIVTVLTLLDCFRCSPVRSSWMQQNSYGKSACH